ncbi:MAG: hypothetical protein JW829_10855 [Pirellulales bacterium]|nr:hypothetical protein [Pirellulales bacterium]
MKKSSIPCVILFLIFAPVAGASYDDTLRPTVEIEEDIYQYEPADNGAGPMWCHGSTCLVRLGENLFASGLEIVSENRLLEILPDGSVGESVRVPLERPFHILMTATARAGSTPSKALDVLGIREGSGTTISFARIQLK